MKALIYTLCITIASVAFAGTKGEAPPCVIPPSIHVVCADVSYGGEHRLYCIDKERRGFYVYGPLGEGA